MSDALLVAQDVSAGYHGHPIVHDLNLTVPAGKVVVLLGPNGAGKTTTLLTLSGDLPALKGEIFVDGKATKSPLYARAKNGLSFVTEERSVFMRLSVAENLRVGRGDTHRALELFPELKPLLRRRAGLLSGGEQQMLSLARALSRTPKILLVDELSLGLAPLVVIRLLDAVQRAAARSRGRRPPGRAARQPGAARRGRGAGDAAGDDRARGTDRRGAIAPRRSRGRLPLRPPERRGARVSKARPRGWVEATTLGDLLVRQALRRGGADAVVFPEARQTYDEALASSERVAAALTGLGIIRGDTVAVLMPNCLDYVHVLFGCALAGVRALLVNARYKEHELSYVLRDAGAVAIVTTDLIGEYVDFVPLIERATADPPPLLRHRVMIGASSPDGYLDRTAFLACGDAVTFEELELRRHAVRVRDVALLMYTSGTTANPKGCLITHEGLVRTAVRHRGQVPAHGGREVLGSAAALPHGGAPAAPSNLEAGGTFMSMTHFEPGAALRQMEAEGCTFTYPCFPTITQSILRHPDYERTRSRQGARAARHGAAGDAARDRDADPAGRRADVLRTHRGRRRGRVLAPRRPRARAHRDGRPPVRGHGGEDRRSRDRRGAAGRPGRRRSSSAGPASSTATTAIRSARPR